MTITKKTMADKLAQDDLVVTFWCPACGQKARLHAESAYRGVEFLCSECFAILRVEDVDPLTMLEVDEEELL